MLAFSVTVSSFKQTHPSVIQDLLELGKNLIADISVYTNANMVPIDTCNTYKLA